jgi:predicted  nucleic acid-binding Zn-ribbon protein
MQCVLCGRFLPNAEEPPKTCPDCGSPKFRRVDSVAPRDVPTPESVAHLKKHVDQCWNWEVNPRTGEKLTHKLELAQRIDRTTPDMVVIQQVCKVCQQLYHQECIPKSRADILAAHGLEKLIEHH